MTVHERQLKKIGELKEGGLRTEREREEGIKGD